MFCSSVLHLSNPQRHRKVLAQRAHVFASALSCIKNHLKGCGCVNCSGSLAASLVASSAKAYNARETTFYGSHVFREAWTQISKILLNMRCVDSSLSLATKSQKAFHALKFLYWDRMCIVKFGIRIQKCLGQNVMCGTSPLAPSTV
jgi:hypothetical protein